MTSAKQDVVILSRQLIEEREYWNKHLSPDLPHSTLPYDFTADPSLRLASFRFRFDPALCAALLKLTSNSPFLRFSALLSALKLCLFKHTANSIIVVGSPALRQSAPAAQSLNALPILTHLDDQLAARQLLLNVRQNLLDAYARQSYPLSHLLADLGLDARGEKCPLFDVGMADAELHTGWPELHTDLSIRIETGGEGVEALVQYNANLYREQSVERMMRHLSEALKVMIGEPQRRVGQIEMLSAEEREQVLGEWNQTETTYPQRSIHQLFQEQAEQTPDAIALVYESEQLSYRELNGRANQLGHYLRGRGVGEVGRQRLVPVLPLLVHLTAQNS